MAVSNERLEVGAVLSTTWSLFVWNVVELVSVVAVVYSPWIAWVLLFGTGDHGVHRSIPFLLAVVLAPVATAAVTWTVLQRQAGRRIGLGQAVRQGLADLGPRLGVGVLTGLIVAGGLLLLVVPGVIAACVLVVAAPVVVVEGTDVRDSLRRSVELTRGRRADIFWTLLVIGLVGALVRWGLGLLLSAFELDRTAPGQTLSEVFLQLVFQALFSTAAVVIYGLLRRQQEGTSLEAVVGALDGPDRTAG